MNLGNVGVKVLTLDESEEKFIDNLDMGPCDFQHWLVLFRIERLALWIHWWRNGSKEVLAEHVDNSRVHRLCYH